MKKSKHVYKKWLIGCIIVFIGILLAIAGMRLWLEDRIYPQISIGSTNLGSKTLRQGLQKLTDDASELSTKSITLEGENISQSFTLSDLGITLLPDKTLVEAYRTKRDQILGGALVFLVPTTITWEYQVENQQLTGALQNNFINPLNVAKNATLDLSPTGDIRINPEINGEMIDTKVLTDSIVAQMYQSPTITVPITTQKPDVTEAILTTLLPEIRAIAKDHTLQESGTTWIIKSSEIVSWITIVEGKVALNPEKIQAYLKTIAPDIENSPINAEIGFNTTTQKIEIRKDAKEGKSLMVVETTQKIQENILAKVDTTDLQVSVTSPEIQANTLDSLGIKTLLGSGESDFRGSSKSRIANIKVAASKISGTVIKPGEEFSFVKLLGPVGASAGYYPELVIKGNKTIPEYGGGICQVSTTVFRAALNASLEITERHAHSYVVSYYGTPGLDATIYIPKPDLRFKNTTGQHILLQHYIVGTKLYYEIYGTDTGKTSKISGPIILQSSGDGSMKTVAYREIYQNGQLLTKDTFYSNYRPPNKVTTNPLE